MAGVAMRLGEAVDVVLAKPRVAGDGQDPHVSRRAAEKPPDGIL